MFLLSSVRQIFWATLLTAGLILSFWARPSSAQTCAERVDIAVYLAVDLSGSMAGAGQQGAANFGTALIDGLNATGHLDRGGAFGFSDVITGEVVMTTNISSLRTALNGVRDLTTGGGTLLYDAIATGAGVINGQSSSFERLLVVLTDGEDTGSTTTQSGAAGSINSGVNAELIFIGSGVSPALSNIASLAGSHVQTSAATAANLTSLVDSVVARTCRNFRPDAGMSRTPSGNLVLGTDGFSIEFNGSSSSDVETLDSGLTFAWTISGPSRTVNPTGPLPTVSFTDADIGSWTVQLRVSDPNGASDTANSSFIIEGVDPEITASGPGVIDALDTLSLSVLPTTDIDGGNLQFVWTILEAPVLADLQPPGPVDWTNSNQGFVTTERDITEVEGASIGNWRFRVVATDNEGKTDDDEVVVVVRNLPPRIDLLVASSEIDIFEPIQVETTIIEDDDGGSLIFDWDIVQVPDTAGVPIQDSVQTGPSFALTTTDLDAGTWKLRLRVEDNEGAVVEEDNITILVDGPVTADIAGPDTVSLLEAFTLSGAGSIDADTPCPNLGGGCHLTDGRPPEISAGITSFEWSLTSIPSEHEGEITAGPVNEVLDIASTSELLEIPIAKLQVGVWQFRLRVEDAEGNEDTEFHSVEVIAPDWPPIAIASGPQVHVLEPGGVLNGAIFVSGEQSFDLDNLLIGETFEPGLGITDFLWVPTIAPVGCAQAVSFGTANGLLFGPGPVVVPSECEGYYSYTLTVTDDDTTPKSSSITTDIFITSCPDVICIEAPTFEFPDEFAFSDETDVEFLYKVDQTLYDLSGCLFGCAADLRVYHESDLLTPVFEATEYNPQPTLFGFSPVLKWNGFIRNTTTGAIERPLDGLYTTTIDLVDLASISLAQDSEDQNISIAVAELSIMPTSDTLLSLNGARAGTDSLRVDYSTTGGVPITEAHLSIHEVGAIVAIDTVVQASGPSGTFSYTGEIGSSTFIDPKLYEYVLKIVGPAGILDESPRMPFTAYSIDLAVDGTLEEDEEVPGVEVSQTSVPIKVTLRPSGLPGDILIQEDAATAVLGSIDYPGGITIPAASADIPGFDDDVAVTEDPATDIFLTAQYTPPGAVLGKEAVDEVRILPLLVDATAPCSVDAREETDGLFVQRRTLPGVVDFGEEQYWMRRLNVKASMSGDVVRISQTAGTPGSIAVFVRPTPGDEPAQVVLPHSMTSDLFDVDDRLDTDVYVQGVSLDPDAVLTVEIMRGGTTLISDEVRFRVYDLATLAGGPIGSFPHWTGRSTFAVGQPVGVALDPAFHDERRGLTGHVFVVDAKTPTEWEANNAIIDVTGGSDALAIPVAGDITTSQAAVWAATSAPGINAPLDAYDVVIDFGDCTAGAATDNTLDPEDIIVPATTAGLIVLPDLTLAGGQGSDIVDYGTDFERAPFGAVCTPITEDAGGTVCPLLGPGLCSFGGVCIDSDGDGTARCTAVDPVGTPACSATTVCVNTNNDEIAHCQGPAPRRVKIPLTFDGISSATLENGQNFRLRGRIVHPSPLAGPYPLVVIAHGRHTPKLVALDPPLGSRPRWSEVAAGTTSGQNYEGYTYLQEHLASHGFVSISVDLDEAFGFAGPTDYGYPQITTAGIDTRAWIMLKNVQDVMDNHPAIAATIATDSIHFLGHSRGAEAVLRAWHIIGDTVGQGPESVGLMGADAAVTGFTQADVKSVMSMAPTSFEASSAPIGTTPFFLLYGTKDGDVNGHSSVVRPLVHLDEARALGPATAVWMTGGNHNFFSDAWPSDDGSSFGGADITRLDQKAIAKAYSLAWLRLNEDQRDYQKLFETSPNTLSPFTFGGTPGLHVQSRLGAQTVLDDFETNSAKTLASSGAAVTLTVTNTDELDLLDSDDADETNTPNRFKQDSKGLLFDWTGPVKSIVYVPSGGSIDLSAARTFVLRAAQEPNHANTTGLGGLADFKITLEDSGGRTATIDAGFGAEVLPVQVSGSKTIAYMNDVRIALERFRVGQQAFDMRAIAKIKLDFGTPLSVQGRLAIDDLEFQQ